MPPELIILSPRGDLARQMRERLEVHLERPPSILTLPADEQVLSELQKGLSPPRAVLVSLDSAYSVRLLGRARQALPEAYLAAAGTAPPSGLINEAMEAGAEHYLGPGHDIGSLVRALSGERGDDARLGRLVCFLSGRSANGASTAAVHVAHALAQERNETVLLADLDFHSGALAYRLGLKPSTTIAELSRLEALSDDAWQRATCKWGPVDVLAAPVSVNTLTARGLPPVDAILESARRRYSVVAADLPCGLSRSVRGIVAQASLTYLFCTPELASLHLAQRRVTELSTGGETVEGLRLVVSRCDSSHVLDEADIERIVGLPVAFRLSNDYEAVCAAENERRLLDPATTLGRELRELGWNAADAVRPRGARATAARLLSFGAAG